MELFSVAKAFIVPADGSQPVELGVLQEVSLDFNIEKKELQGQNRFPLLSVQGKGTVSGKCSMARFNAETLSALLGATKSTGAKLLGNVVAAIPNTTVYTVTVVPPSSGVFTVDGGVILVGASELFNVQMTQVSGTPAAGQYSVALGVYTFAAADKGKSVIIDYEYSTATGSTITVGNPVLGSSFPFSLWAKSVFQGKEVVIKLPNVVSEKFSMPLKLGEFTIPDFDFSVFADGTGNICYISTSD